MNHQSIMTFRPLRHLATLLLVVFAALLTSCNDPEREANFNEFLESHDPALKAKRDELLLAMEGIRKKRSELRKMRSNYQSDAARNRIDGLISQADERLTQLEGALAAIDEKIELAMINRDLDRADAGGLRSKEADELNSTTQELINQANQLRAIMDNTEAPMDDEPGSGSSTSIAPSSSNGSTPRGQSSATQTRVAEAKSELAAINARIENERARYQAGQNTINRLTNFKRTPVQEGSQAYYQCVEAARIMHEVQINAPALLAEKKRLETLIRELESSNRN